jgi:hypothetical protein
MRGLGRRLRSNFGIGSSRMAIRSQHAWYWRWLLNILMMVAVAAIVWWVVQNSYRITGSSLDEVRQQITALTAQNKALKAELDTAKATLVERERQLQIEKAAQGELARTVAQLQEENAAQKEDLGFLRRLMSSGASPEGVGVTDLKVERDPGSGEFLYHMLLTQGGQRKQDFKGRVQIVAHVEQGSAAKAIVYPDPASPEASASFEFRFYHKVEGRLAIPEGAVLRSVEVRVLALPGGQVKLSRTVNLP